MRIILDTNTIISELFWRGKPFQVLELMRLGRIKVYTSGAILEEQILPANKVWRCYNIRLEGACARLTHPTELLI